MAERGIELILGSGSDDFTSKLHRIRRGGKPYVFATDSCMAVLVPWTHPFLSNRDKAVEDPDKSSRILKCLEQCDYDVPPHRISFARLRDWCGSPTALCERCGGKGYTEVKCRACVGTGRQERSCEHCDETHDCCCDECDGTGHEEEACVCAAPRQGRLFGVLLNLKLLARLLAVLPQQEEIEVMVHPDPYRAVKFIMGDSLGLLMPLAGDRGEPVSVFPDENEKEQIP